MNTRRILSSLTIAFACVCALFTQAAAEPSTNSASTGKPVHFVPDSQEFWDFSKNWTTSYGPAYRDAAAGPSSFLPCTGQYALCFHSGPEPLPCELTADGRFANCKCTVQTGLNFVLMTSILNYEVYRETVAVCGPDGSKCSTHPDKAPVCKAIKQGKLIPGADVISTYSPGHRSDLVKLITNAPSKPKLTICPKVPYSKVSYAGCMTAPCKTTKPGYAVCSCPIFWGTFQLVQPSAQCTLGDDLVWSAAYAPALDANH